MKRLIYIAIVGLIVAVPVLMRPAYAASASLYLSPASANTPAGNTLTISILENSASEPVNAVQANLSYPSDLLTFVGISSSPAFSIVAENSGGGGSVRIGRGALPAVSGSQVVAHVRFKVMGSGTASISFAGGSSIASARSNTDVMTASPSRSYPLGAPASAAPAPKPRLADVRLKACQDREKTIDNIMSRMAKRGQKHLELFTTIATRVEKFYTDKGKNLSNYNALVADVNAKKSTAQTAIDTVKANVLAFKCDGSDPKGTVAGFKDAVKTETTALQDYRASVKNLIIGVKSVEGGDN